MTCQELVELVTDYLEGALPPAERERFEAHVAGCPGCDAHLGQMRATVAAAAAAGALAPAPDVGPLLQAFRDFRRG